MRVRYQKTAGRENNLHGPRSMDCGHLHLTPLEASHCTVKGFPHSHQFVRATENKGTTWRSLTQEETQEPRKKRGEPDA